MTISMNFVVFNKRGYFSPTRTPLYVSMSLYFLFICQFCVAIDIPGHHSWTSQTLLAPTSHATLAVATIAYQIYVPVNVLYNVHVNVNANDENLCRCYEASVSMS